VYHFCSKFTFCSFDAAKIQIVAAITK